MSLTTCYDVFECFVTAANAGFCIKQESDKDKEFHFQNWVGNRLDELSLNYDEVGRNTYPDYRLVDVPEGYEVKGLQSPGRIANYDSNSQVPSGSHRGRKIFYIFGLYPKSMLPYPKDANGHRKYPLLDLVVCHGDFLNADHNYIHKNKNIKGFGTYGDIMIRDRKMYVPPTPFAITEGTGGFRTLIIPESMEREDDRFQVVGRLTRVEAEKIITAYTFNLQTNSLIAEEIDNPNAGKEHRFIACRLKGDPCNPVSIRTKPIDIDAEEEFEDD
ncbi:MAG: hypothetical protein Q8Q57_04740 [Methylotenera sp.]|nr:hypothetical protein [Methylotenera sp.]